VPAASSLTLSAPTTRHAGMGQYTNWRKKLVVLITGDASRAQLLDFLAEMLVPQSTTGYRFMHCVIMLDHDVFSAADRRFFSSHKFFKTAVTYIRGSAFSQDDLVRASAHRPETKAAFVMTQQTEHDQADHRNLARVLALRRHLPTLPVYVMLRHSSNLQYLAAAGVQSSNALCLDTVRYGLLSSNVLAPGTIPLLLNLFSAHVPASSVGGASSSERLRRYVEAHMARAAEARRRHRERKVAAASHSHTDVGVAVAPSSLREAVTSAGREIAAREELSMGGRPAVGRREQQTGEGSGENGWEAPPRAEIAHIEGAPAGIASGQRPSRDATGLVRGAASEIRDVAKTLASPHGTRYLQGSALEGGASDFAAPVDTTVREPTVDVDRLPTSPPPSAGQGAEKARDGGETSSAGLSQPAPVLIGLTGPEAHPLRAPEAPVPARLEGLSPAAASDFSAGGATEAVLPMPLQPGGHVGSLGTGVHGSAPAPSSSAAPHRPQAAPHHHRREHEGHDTGHQHHHHQHQQHPHAGHDTSHQRQPEKPPARGMTPSYEFSGFGHLAMEAEFAAGMRNELHQVGCPSWLHGCTLREAALLVYCAPLALTLLAERGEDTSDADAPAGLDWQPQAAAAGRRLRLMVRERGVLGLLDAMEDDKLLLAKHPVILLAVLTASSLRPAAVATTPRSQQHQRSARNGTRHASAASSVRQKGVVAEDAPPLARRSAALLREALRSPWHGAARSGEMRPSDTWSMAPEPGGEAAAQDGSQENRTSSGRFTLVPAGASGSSSMPRRLGERTAASPVGRKARARHDADAPASPTTPAGSRDIEQLHSFRRLLGSGHEGGPCLLMDFTCGYRLREGDELFFVFGETDSTPSGLDIIRSGLPALVLQTVRGRAGKPLAFPTTTAETSDSEPEHRAGGPSRRRTTPLAQPVGAKHVTPVTHTTDRPTSTDGARNGSSHGVAPSTHEAVRGPAPSAPSPSSMLPPSLVIRTHSKVWAGAATHSPSAAGRGTGMPAWHRTPRLMQRRTQSQGRLGPGPESPRRTDDGVTAQRRRSVGVGSIDSPQLRPHTDHPSRLPQQPAVGFETNQRSPSPPTARHGESSVILAAASDRSIELPPAWPQSAGRGTASLGASSAFTAAAAAPAAASESTSAAVAAFTGIDDEEGTAQCVAARHGATSPPASHAPSAAHPEQQQPPGGQTDTRKAGGPSPASVPSAGAVRSRGGGGGQKAPAAPSSLRPLTHGVKCLPEIRNHILVLADVPYEQLQPLLRPLARFVSHDIVVLSSGLSGDMKAMEPAMKWICLDASGTEDDEAADVELAAEAAYQGAQQRKAGLRRRLAGTPTPSPTPSSPTSPTSAKGPSSPRSRGSWDSEESSDAEGGVSICSPDLPQAGPLGSMGTAEGPSPAPGSTRAGSRWRFLQSLVVKQAPGVPKRTLTQVVLLRGNPLQPSHLVKAGLMRASRVLVLSNLGPHAPETGEISTSGEATLESSTSNQIGAGWSGDQWDKAGSFNPTELSSDTRCLLSTLLLESVLSIHRPALLAGTTSEFTSSSSLLLLGPAPRSSGRTSLSTPYPRVGMAIKACPGPPAAGFALRDSGFVGRGGDAGSHTRAPAPAAAGRPGMSLVRRVILASKTEAREPTRHEEGGSAAPPSGGNTARAQSPRYSPGIPPSDSVSHADFVGHRGHAPRDGTPRSTASHQAAMSPGTRERRQQIAQASRARMPERAHGCHWSEDGPGCDAPQTSEPVPTSEGSPPTGAPSAEASDTTPAGSGAAQDSHGRARSSTATHSSARWRPLPPDALYGRGPFRAFVARAFEALFGCCCRSRQTAVSASPQQVAPTSSSSTVGVGARRSSGATRATSDVTDAATGVAVESAAARLPAVESAAPARMGGGAGLNPAASRKKRIQAKVTRGADRGINADVDQFLRSHAGLKWSFRYAAGRVMPVAALNGLITQAFFNPGSLSLLHAVCRGEGAAVRHMRIPDGIIRELHDIQGSRRRTLEASRHAAAISRKSATVEQHEPRGDAMPAPPIVQLGSGTVIQPLGPYVGVDVYQGPQHECAYSGEGRVEEDPDAPTYCRYLSSPREDDVCAFSTLFFLLMLRYGLLSLGLYRRPDWLGSPLAYTQSSPPLLSRVRPGDIIFVLVPVGASLHEDVAAALL